MDLATASASAGEPPELEAREELAPCVAVVGPANSGKTTLLHLLDQALQLHPEAPLAYVVKGNPDGTGRYLFHAPELREALKPWVKGRWGAVTVETIGEWIASCRRRLELVLVDVGGRHSESNQNLFRRCSHFLVIARRLPEPERERSEGMESWLEAGRRAGLAPVARVHSLWKVGEAKLAPAEDGVPTGNFRADAAEPGDALNRPLVESLTDALLALRLRRGPPGYLDLRLPRDWTFDDLPDLGGLAAVVERSAARGTVVLGGRAPIWAYAAALHRILDRRPSAAVEVFEPKAPSGLVAVPEALGGQGAAEGARSLSVQWATAPAKAGALLKLEITTPDRFLAPDFARHLQGLPLPQGEPAAGPVVVSGAGPIWLHLAYSRWLRAQFGGRRIGVWDARTRSAVFVAGPGALGAEGWDLG